ncbi:hypothetical protein EC973_000466 [Apophysomyces ossiformis]|uniref:Myb-like domain-containing protein n=1 Tax=Apophysomyces ossiformis TaxID=679940 RepID=A0A8H7ENT7_9FUNG|nr:hypothetical protein EC973_000466 [Apophysomyces ossiformis]
MDRDDVVMEESVAPALNATEEKIRAKQEWVKQLRLKFCIRPDFEITKNMIHEDGTLNQDYFRPPKGAKREEARKWTEMEKALLIQGIEKYGIGHFGEISKELLPKWSTNDLRIKCIRLIGRQNLQLYRDWKGNAQDIAREYERNKAVGLKYGTWKQGVLVYDDNGLVEKELLASNNAADEDVDMES